MRRPMPFLAVAGLFVTMSAAALEPDAAQTPALRLLYCRSGADNTPSPWETSGLLSIGRVSGVMTPPHPIVIARRVCGPELPDATCFAVPGQLMCRGYLVERVLRATAFLLARWLVAGAPDYERFQAENDRAVIDAFRAADGLDVVPIAAELVERIR